MRPRADSIHRRSQRSRAAPVRDDAGFAAATVLAVVSMVAVLSALIVFLTTGDHRGDAVANTESQPGPTAPPPSRPEPHQQTAVTPPSTPLQHASPVAPQQPASQHQPQHPQPTHHPTHQPGQAGTVQHTTQQTRDAYVEVYNNSTIQGLAARTAAALRRVGWQVVGVDNWYGDIPSNTVYYPPQLKTQALLLANDLGISRTHDAVSPMRFDRLTVILTSSP
jgi:hypothetical protein